MYHFILVSLEQRYTETHIYITWICKFVEEAKICNRDLMIDIYRGLEKKNQLCEKNKIYELLRKKEKKQHYPLITLY